MLTKRVIPCLDVHDGRVVKGVRFQNLRDEGDPVEAATRYDQAGADELVFLDITASHHKRMPIVELAARTADCVFIPFTMGGGISDIQLMRNILRSGADKISLNSPAVNNPDLITEAAMRFGSQCVVVAIDPKLGPDGRWEVFINGGRKPTGLHPVEWAQEVVRRGAGEILLTSMDADGTRNGYDIKLTRAVAEAVNVPVIASGGAGALDHFVEVFRETGADAALCSSLLHQGELTIPQIKRHLKAAGIPVRMVDGAVG